MNTLHEFRSAVATVGPKAAAVFGSGLSGAADGHFAPVASVPYADVPGLVPPTVAGHGGRLAVGHWGGVPVLVCFGRVHFYEGHPWDRVTALVRLVADLGVKSLVLTNATGGIRGDLNPGDLMPIGGHLKLLDGEAWKELVRAGSVSDGLRATGSHASGSDFWHHVPLLEAATGKPAGVYAGLTGPCYETPAEIRALRTIGADAVGMSTAVEAETAAELGLTVAGVSCVTNKAAGLTAGTLNHHEVEEVAKQAVGRLGRVLSAVFRAA